MSITCLLFDIKNPFIHGTQLWPGQFSGGWQPWAVTDISPSPHFA
jgi:hypothetical protein